MADRADAVSGRRRGLGVWLVAIGGLQVVALCTLLWLPMPSLGGPGSKLRRLFFLMEVVPGLVPGSSFAETTPGRLVDGLGRIENLPQRAWPLFWAGLIAMAAQAVGHGALKALRLDRAFRGAEAWALGFGVGAALLSIATLLAGRVGGLGTASARTIVGVLAVGGTVLASRDWRRGRGGGSARAEGDRVGRVWSWGVIVVVAPVVGLMVLGALQPTIEYDALEYHLQGPKEWFQAGRIEFLPHNVYTAMPFGVEMLTLLAMHATGDWYVGALVGQVLIAGFAPATALLLAATCRRLDAPRAGVVAALLYLTTPWIFRLAVFPFVEGPLCFYHAALIFVACGMLRGGGQEVGLESPAYGAVPASGWPLMGLLAGGAMGCKYPGLISAVLPFGFLAARAALRGRSARPLIGYALGVGLVIGPWLVKNFVDTGNPVFPLAFQVFGGREWDEAARGRWDAAHGPRPVTMATLTEGAAGVLGRSDWQSPLYLLFAPLAFLRRETRAPALAIGGFAVYVFATWFLLTHRLERFWLPLMPALAILAGLGFDGLKPARAGWTAWSLALVGIGTVANLSFIATPLCGPTEWTGDMARARAEAIEVNPPLAELDRRLPPGSKVLIVGQAGVFFLDRPKLYNTVFNREIVEGLMAGRGPEEARRELAGRRITHIYVDWAEVERHRKPGGYGFTPFVTPARFAGLVDAGVLGSPVLMSNDGRHVVYTVRPIEDAP